MKQLHHYWLSLQAREQRLLIIAGAALLVAAAYGLIWQPLHQSRVTQQQAVQAAQQQFLYLQTQLPKLTQNTALTRTNGSLTEIVSDTARQLNIQVTRMQPQNEQLQLSLADVPFEALLTWLEQLQYQHGLRLVQFDVAAADTPGVVRVRRMVVE